MEMIYFYGISGTLFLLSGISAALCKRMPTEKGIIAPYRARNFMKTPVIFSVILSALTYLTNFGPGSNLVSVSFVIGLNCAFCIWLIARPFSYKNFLSNW